VHKNMSNWRLPTSSRMTVWCALKRSRGFCNCHARHVLSVHVRMSWKCLSFCIPCKGNAGDFARRTGDAFGCMRHIIVIRTCEAYYSYSDAWDILLLFGHMRHIIVIRTHETYYCYSDAWSSICTRPSLRTQARVSEKVSAHQDACASNHTC
jgi:hypothetical protein